MPSAPPSSLVLRRAGIVGLCTDNDGIVARQGDAGAPTIATSHGSMYALALTPGTYEVCPERNACTFAACKACVTVTLATGDRKRVDLEVSTGAFAPYAVMRAR